MKNLNKSSDDLFVDGMNSEFEKEKPKESDTTTKKVLSDDKATVVTTESPMQRRLMKMNA